MTNKIGDIVHDKNSWNKQFYVVESYDENTKKYTLNPINKIEVLSTVLNIQYADTIDTYERINKK